MFWLQYFSVCFFALHPGGPGGLRGQPRALMVSKFSVLRNLGSSAQRGLGLYLFLCDLCTRGTSSVSFGATNLWRTLIV